VELAVGVRAGGPAGVAGHGACYQFWPAWAFGVEFEGTLQGVAQCGGCIGDKADAVAALWFGVQVGYGVGQTTGSMHNGQCTVTQGDQLAQTTRLEGAGHEEEVCTRVDAAGERTIKTDVRANVRTAGGQFAEELLVARMPGSQDDQLQW